MDAAAGNLVRLRFNGIPLELSGRDREFFLFLFWKESKSATYKEIWDKLIQDKSGKGYRQDPNGGGPPDTLRRIKCNANGKFMDAFGDPPTGAFWIEKVKGYGYRLNQESLVWQQARGRPDRSNELPLEPKVLDRRKGKGYRR